MALFAPRLVCLGEHDDYCWAMLLRRGLCLGGVVMGSGFMGDHAPEMRRG